MVVTIAAWFLVGVIIAGVLRLILLGGVPHNPSDEELAELRPSDHTEGTP